MSFSFYVKIYILFLFFFLNKLYANPLEIEVHNIGQGNCILLKAQQPGKNPDYMLVDIGTAAYKQEWRFGNQLSPVKKEPETSFSTAVQLSEVISPKKGMIPKQYMQEQKAYGEKLKDKKEDDFIQALRKKLQRDVEENEESEEKDTIPPIFIKTVVITHPDTDHYNWLTKLFHQEGDHIEHLILGGLPERYDASGILGFEEWLEKRMRLGAKIYFPAIKRHPITSLEDVIPSLERTFKSHTFTRPRKYLKRFKEAFDFGEGIKISVLSLNPTHFFGQKETVLRMSDSEDDNTDSLVLKIKNGKSSAILTGDATGLTTTRILDNYSDELDFLKTDVLLASHHGSFTHGCNNEAWIAATQPQYVVISNGLKHDHPNEDAYASLKTSSRLLRVPQHKIFVAKSTQKGYMHTTQSAIYSTLTSGTIYIQLDKDGMVTLSTEEEKKIQTLTSTKHPQDKKEEIMIGQTGNTLLLSPTPQKVKRSSSRLGNPELIPQELNFEEIDQELGTHKSKDKKRKATDETKSSQPPKKSKRR